LKELGLENFKKDNLDYLKNGKENVEDIDDVKWFEEIS